MSLQQKEKCIVTIAAFAAQGNMINLKSSLEQGLEAGLTINEIKEVLVQLYAYAGFPRSLNALHNLMSVVEERKKMGKNDREGKDSTPISSPKSLLEFGTENQTKLVGRPINGGVYDFAPAIDQFLKKHLFGDIFGRDVLDWRLRELVTIAALASMEGVENQLHSHFAVGLHNGLTQLQLEEIVSIVEQEVSSKRGLAARHVLQAVTGIKNHSSASKPQDFIFTTGELITNENFTGRVWLNSLIQGDSSNKVQVGNVSFEPGARTKWHYHPAGQILLAIDGKGYYQEKGKPRRILQKGDVVKCPPNLPHWHGASPEEGFVQIAITSSELGQTVWLQEVGEQEYKD